MPLMSDTPVDIPRLLAALRGSDSAACTSAAEDAAAVCVTPSQSVARDGLCAAGLLAALASVLASHKLNRTSPAVPACCRTVSALLRGPHTSAVQAAVDNDGPGLVPRLVDLLNTALPPDMTSAAAVEALAALLTASNACRDAALQPGVPAASRLTALLLGPLSPSNEAAACAVQCTAELAQSGSGRESLRDASSFPALARAIHTCGLDSQLGCYACLTLLRCAHDDGLRQSLHDGGRVAWTLLDTRCVAGVTGDPSPPSRPAGRLAAVLLIGLLFCNVRDGNPGAARLLSRFEAPRHLAALLDEGIASQRKQQPCVRPSGSFAAYGAWWTAAEVVLYSRFCAEHPALVTAMADHGAHAKIGQLLGNAAMSGAMPPHPAVMLDATVATAACASRDLVSAAARELRAAEHAFVAAREMLEVPMSNAVAALCCAAGPPQGEHPDGEDDGAREQAGSGAGRRPGYKARLTGKDRSSSWT